MSFKGKNVIKGSYGDASKIGQVALTVNGSVSLEEGGILTAIGVEILFYLMLCRVDTE